MTQKEEHIVAIDIFRQTKHFILLSNDRSNALSDCVYPGVGISNYLNENISLDRCIIIFKIFGEP